MADSDVIGDNFSGIIYLAECGQVSLFRNHMSITGNQLCKSATRFCCGNGLLRCRGTLPEF